MRMRMRERKREGEIEDINKGDGITRYREKGKEE